MFGDRSNNAIEGCWQNTQEQLGNGSIATADKALFDPRYFEFVITK